MAVTNGTYNATNVSQKFRGSMRKPALAATNTQTTLQKGGTGAATNPLLHTFNQSSNQTLEATSTQAGHPQ